MTEGKQTALQAFNLTIGYKTHNKIIKRVSGPHNLEIRPGQLICLLGPNGSGKSTLLRSLAGLQPVLEGRVQIGGHELGAMSTGQLARQLSLVLTETTRPGNLDVYSLVALGRYPYTGWLGRLNETDKEKVAFGIRSVQLEGFVDRKVDELSDGEYQRVMLARALAQDTPVIILDEPTAHLDLPNRIELMRLLHQLSASLNKGILISTHELDLALQVADEIWLMDTGGLIQTGIPEELVLNGAFEAAFDKSGKLFDKNTGTFTIHKPSGDKIFIAGEGASVFWTQKALTRLGYRITGSAAEALISISITRQVNDTIWSLQRDTTSENFNSLGKLTRFLCIRDINS